MRYTLFRSEKLLVYTLICIARQIGTSRSHGYPSFVVRGLAIIIFP